MFDDAAHAAVLSPASHFMIADVYARPAKATAGASPEPTDPTRRLPAGPRQTGTDVIVSGFVPTLRSIPAGFTQASLLVLGDGIHHTWTTWGNSLTDLSGKTRPANDADAGLKSFGYWTDNGAGYYYNYDPQLGYAGTLKALAAKMKQLRIPLGYVQLDSWWYEKSYTGPDGAEGEPYKNKNLPRGPWNAYGGLLSYTADKDLFPGGLEDFHDQIGRPLITHNRWVDLNSPYRKSYAITGVAAIDPRWWDDVADYLKRCGVVTYEQDWLDRIYQYSPALQTTPDAADAFMDNMARATKSRGLDLQYCMGLPRHYLQGTRYDNLTTVRVSEDRFERDKWEWSLYVSQLAGALGEWPWVDTFFSGETPNLLLANLSAGMVGVGDTIEQIDAGDIRHVIRPDGVIVKPDTPLVPLDQTYVSDATDQSAPMIAATTTDHGTLSAGYVFSFPRSARQTTGEFRPADLGIAGDAIVYDAVAHTATAVAAGQAFTVSFNSAAYAHAWSYDIVVPVSHGGIAFLGDAERFVSLGRQRIDRLRETPRGIEARVRFAAGEANVVLHGFAPAEPRAALIGGGAIDAHTYDATTGAFTATVSPPAGADTADVSFERP